MNPIQMFCTWYMRKALKQQKQQKLTDEDKAKQKMYKDLQELYSFIKWLNTKAFQNRKQRKVFWRNVMMGKPVMEDVLSRIIIRYSPEEKNKKEVSKNEMQKLPKKTSK